MIIIYGPAGCGKTTNAEPLATFFDCTNIVEGEIYNIAGFSKDTLILTSKLRAVNLCKENIHLESISVLSFGLAMKLAKLYDWKNTP